MSQSIQYRELEYDALDEVEALWLDLKEYQRSKTNHFHEHYLKVNFADRKADLKSKELVKIILAEGTGNSRVEKIGFCMVSLDNEVGQIESLFVAEDSRRKGLGGVLLERGIRLLKEHRPRHIRLLVGEGNEDVVSFYQKYGFVKRATQLELL